MMYRMELHRCVWCSGADSDGLFQNLLMHLRMGMSASRPRLHTSAHSRGEQGEDGGSRVRGGSGVYVFHFKLYDHVRLGNRYLAFSG